MSKYSSFSAFLCAEEKRKERKPVLIQRQKPVLSEWISSNLINGLHLMDDADLFFILNFNEYFWRTKSKVAVRRSGNKRLRVTLILLLSIAPWKFGQVSPKQPVSQFRCQLPQLPSNFYRPQNSSKFWAGLLAAVTTPHQLAGCIYTVIWWQQDYTADTPWAVLERNHITRPSSSLHWLHHSKYGKWPGYNTIQQSLSALQGMR